MALARKLYVSEGIPEVDPHNAFARYYIRALSGPVDRSVPREAQFTRLILSNTHMNDGHIEALCQALSSSFEQNGPTNCSLTLLEEIDISNNPEITSGGLTKLFDTLRFISTVRRESAHRHDSPAASPSKQAQSLAAAVAFARSFEPQHTDTNDTTAEDNKEIEHSEGAVIGDVLEFVTPTVAQRSKSGDACNALWRINAAQTTIQTSRELASSVVSFLRISRALFDIQLPPPNADERRSLEDAEQSDRAARRTDMILKRIISATDVEVLPTNHPLDDRALFWAQDVQMNAKLNKFPSAMKERVLAAMVRHTSDPLTLMNASTMDLSGPTTSDDVNRTHPKVYTSESAAFLSEVLSETCLVTMVDLSNNIRGDEATIALAPFLTRNRSVVDLRLRSNGIATAGGLALAEALRSNTTLVELDLADNSCSDVVATAFRELIVLNSSRIGFVNWERNCVSPNLVADANYQLMLNTQPRMVKETIVRLTQHDPRLTRVMWNATEPIITDNTVKVLMQSVRGSELVTHIDVSNSNITDEGARYLAEIIIQCPNLRTVVVQYNHITDEGALVLLHALPRSRSIERLDLKFQQPHPISHKLLQSIEQISNLGNQPYEIRKKGLALVVNDPSCTEVDLSVYDGERRVTDETIQTLANLMGNNTHVNRITLSGNRFKVTGASIPIVTSIAGFLTHLDLSGLYLYDKDVIEPLSELLSRQPSPALRELNLADNQLTRAASYELAIIARNCNDIIQNINFDGNPAISNQDRDVVDFYCGVNRYTKAFKNIILDIEANDKPQLTEVNFTVVERAVAQGTSYRYAKEFDDHSARLLCIALAQNSTIHKVIFGGNRCTDVGATYWAQLLRVNVTIHHLDLTCNQIGVEGLTEIAEALESSNAVKVFGFEGNPGAKDLALHRRLLAAVRKSSVEPESVRTNTYAAAHSVSNTHHAKALQLSLAQAAEVDKMVEDAIMHEAMAGYKIAKARKNYNALNQQQQQHQLIEGPAGATSGGAEPATSPSSYGGTRTKDASSILAPLTMGSYVEAISSVPAYLLKPQSAAPAADRVNVIEDKGSAFSEGMS